MLSTDAATSAATWYNLAAAWQRWPPFDPTVDWRSTSVDRWLTGGPAVAPVMAPVTAGKPRGQVRGSGIEYSGSTRGSLSLVDPAGGYEVRCPMLIIGVLITRWDEMTRMPLTFALSRV
ncbi:hypothetical protein Tco_0253379 [Tanacetum coccineum]